MSQEPKYTYDDDIYSDYYKEAFGFRPRGGTGWDQMTPDQKQEHWDWLGECVEARWAEEKARQAEAREVFEATIKRVQETCNCGWVRAFEILAEAEEVNLEHIIATRPQFVGQYGFYVEHWFWDMDLSFEDGLEFAQRYHDAKLTPVRRAA